MHEVQPWRAGRKSASALRRSCGLVLLQELFVDLRVEEAGIGVPVHEGEDLQLRFVEGVGGWLHHVSVDDLAHAGVQADLHMPT